jgi:hypothetical protein
MLLSATGNMIGDAGTQALAATLPKTLQHLDLSRMRVLLIFFGCAVIPL